MKTKQISEKAILNNYSTSYWLQAAIKKSESRDILDALNDAETLVEILKIRLNKIQGK